MNDVPEFIDNRNGNTLELALRRVLGANDSAFAENSTVRPAEVAIAAAFFSPKGLADLAPQLEGIPRVRLLFGVEAPRDVEVQRPKVGERIEDFEARLIQQGLREADEAARAARDRFPFTRDGVQALRRLIAQLRGQHLAAIGHQTVFDVGTANIESKQSHGQAAAQSMGALCWDWR